MAALLVGLATPAFAARVHWLEPDAIGAGQTASLDLVFEDTAPAGPIALPHVDGLRVVGAPAQASDISIVNGHRSASLTLSYPVRAERTGTLHVPAFDVETSDGTQRVAALDLEVGRAMVRDRSGAARALEDAVQARLTPSTLTPYAGEVVDLDLRITLDGNHSGQVVGAPTWDAGGLAVEPWSDGHAVRTSGGNAVRFHTRAVAPQAGRLEVAPAEQEVQLETGRGRNPLADFDPFGAMQRMGGSRLFDSFFGAPQMTAVTARSNGVQLDVRPLPQPAPAGFSGAVGDFTLESTLTPDHPKTGEPVTWTLTLSGTGNWPNGVALPARAVPADLRTLQPKQRSSFGDHGRFSGEVSEDLVIVPNQPGPLALAPVRFVYFNPTSGRYETAEATPPTLEVTGAPLPAASAPAPAPAAVAAPSSEPAPLAAPALGSPLDGRAPTLAPLPWTTLRWWLIAPFALAFGLRLARRAWRVWHDHPRRRARRTARRMQVAIRAARDAASVEARLAALLDWQRAAARLLDIDLAAPTAEQVRGIGDARWAEVWAASERALYARGHGLPEQWYAAALALCAPPRGGRAARRGRRSRPLVATAATASLLLLALAMPSWGDEREALRTQVEAAPLDWIARYNLGLAEAQAGDSGRALGETAAALALAPRQAVVRANARALAASVPGAEATLAPLLDHRLAALASPAHWQLTLLAGAVLAAAGIAVGRRRPSSLLLAAGALAMAVAGVALRAQGAFADPRAALVARAAALHPLPTEAAPAADAPALAPGSLVIAGGDFLGWRQVRRADGATGWVRGSDLVPLYAPPARPRGETAA
ncbi:protein BatD [bacterium]|nr:protein BatD [bacterium]